MWVQLVDKDPPFGFSLNFPHYLKGGFPSAFVAGQCLAALTGFLLSPVLFYLRRA